jgi:hypothetical protein
MDGNTMIKKIFISILALLAFISALGFSTQNGELIECVSRQTTIRGTLRNGANAGTLTPTFCTSAAGAGYGIIVTAGSTARYRQTN